VLALSPKLHHYSPNALAQVPSLSIGVSIPIAPPAIRTPMGHHHWTPHLSMRRMRLARLGALPRSVTISTGVGPSCDVQRVTEIVHSRTPGCGSREGTVATTRVNPRPRPSRLNPPICTPPPNAHPKSASATGPLSRSSSSSSPLKSNLILEPTLIAGTGPVNRKGSTRRSSRNANFGRRRVHCSASARFNCGHSHLFRSWSVIGIRTVPLCRRPKALDCL